MRGGDLPVESGERKEHKYRDLVEQEATRTLVKSNAFRPPFRGGYDGAEAHHGREPDKGEREPCPRRSAVAEVLHRDQYVRRRQHNVQHQLEDHRHQEGGHYLGARLDRVAEHGSWHTIEGVHRANSLLR